jgi:hypothetical protein
MLSACFEWAPPKPKASFRVCIRAFAPEKRTRLKGKKGSMSLEVMPVSMENARSLAGLGGE